MRRNPAIELFRTFMMFGIVLLHVCQLRPGLWPNNVLVFCVPGFVIISGYFSIRFSWRKILKLYLVAVYASLIIPLAGGCWTLSSYFSEVLRVWNVRLDAVSPSGFWFLHAYAVMSVLAIPVEMVLEGELTREKACRLRQISVPVLIAVFGWGFLTKFNALAPLVPTVNGLQAFSPITLFASYLAGRNLAVWEKLNGKVPWKLSVGCLVASLVLLSVSRTYLCGYNSLVSVALAASAFCLFRDIRIPDRLAKVILAIAPSMFAVYLIHTHMYWVGMEHSYMVFGRLILKALSPHLGSVLAVGVTALAVFGCALLLDLPRRMVESWRVREWVSL